MCWQNEKEHFRNTVLMSHLRIVPSVYVSHFLSMKEQNKINQSINKKITWISKTLQELHLAFPPFFRASKNQRKVDVDIYFRSSFKVNIINTFLQFCIVLIIFEETSDLHFISIYLSLFDYSPIIVLIY